MAAVEEMKKAGGSCDEISSAQCEGGSSDEYKQQLWRNGGGGVSRRLAAGEATALVQVMSCRSADGASAVSCESSGGELQEYRRSNSGGGELQECGWSGSGEL